VGRAEAATAGAALEKKLKMLRCCFPVESGAAGFCRRARSLAGVRAVVARDLSSAIFAVHDFPVLAASSFFESESKCYPRVRFHGDFLIPDATGPMTRKALQGCSPPSPAIDQNQASSLTGQNPQ